MRPRKLRFAGIGAFPGLVEIDFEALDRKGLYLIVGPTGSGKTTIFDAITYALYGTVAQERGNAIVSAYPDSEKPFIEFEFTQGERRFLVHREPALPTKGVTKDKQWLRELDQNGEQMSSITGAKEIGSRITEAVGLTSGEFMKVVLLPQGKFQQFLLATGGEKQDLLQAIFGTLTYTRITKALDAEAQRRTNDVESGRIELSNSHAIVDASISSISGLQEFDELPDHKSDLNAAIDFIARATEVLTRREQESRDRQADLNGRLKVASQEADRFDKAIRLKALQSDEKAESVRHKEALSSLFGHERSVPVVRAIKKMETAVTQQERRSTAAASTRAEIQQSMKAMKVPEAPLDAVRSGIPTASAAALSTDFAKIQSQLTEAAAAYSKLEDLSRELAIGTRESKATQASVASLKKELTQATASSTRLAKRLADVRKKAKGLAAAEKELHKLEALLEKSDSTAAKQAVEKAQRALASAQKESDKAEIAYRDVQVRRTSALAGELAAELEDADPCPVCGSTEHPKKARRQSGRGVDMAAAEQKRNKATDQRIRAERDLEDAIKLFETTKKHAAELPTPAAQARIIKTFEDLSEIAETVEALQEEVEDAREHELELKDELSSTQQELSELNATNRELSKQVKQITSSVSSVGKSADVTASLKCCKQTQSLIKKLDSELSALEQVRGEVESARRSVAESLQASGYKTEKAALSHLLTDESQRTLQDFVQSFETRAKEISKLEAAVGDGPVPKVRPAVEDLEEQLAATDAAAAAASAAVGAARSAHEQITRAGRDIQRTESRIEEAESLANKAKALHSVFANEHSSRGLLGLEVWVQRALFEEVCLVANDRLLQLSARRYALTLDPDEGGVRKKKSSGLDLYVFDSFSGKSRPVQTLSGGEQFLTSVALALALAEVVQRHAGGIELPCLFIDEGFGSLDAGTLDTAVSVLHQIQDSGRTVGCITHVEEMKERLPIGISLTKTDRGSTLKVLAD